MIERAVEKGAERLSFEYLGCGFDVYTNLPDLSTFVSAVWEHFREVPPLRHERRRLFTVLRESPDSISLHIDDDAFYVGERAGLEAIVYQKMADWFLCGHANMVPFHAAALAGPDVGLLLLGGRGNGKSTTAAALVDRGFRLLSDDAAVLDLERQQIHPFPRALGLLDTDEAKNGHLAAATLGGPVATMKRIPRGTKKLFYQLSRDKLMSSPIEATHLIFLDGAKPSGELALFLAAPPIQPAKEWVGLPAFEYVDGKLPFIRLEQGRDPTDLLEACVQGGLLPLGIEPIKKTPIRFLTQAKAARPQAQDALTRLWQSLKPAAFIDKKSGELYFQLAGFMKNLQMWTVKPGPVAETVDLIVKLTEEETAIPKNRKIPPEREVR